jgi:hypothetical protein
MLNELEKRVQLMKNVNYYKYKMKIISIEVFFKHEHLFA